MKLLNEIMQAYELVIVLTGPLTPEVVLLNLISTNKIRCCK